MVLLQILRIREIYVLREVINLEGLLLLITVLVLIHLNRHLLLRISLSVLVIILIHRILQSNFALLKVHIPPNGTLIQD